MSTSLLLPAMASVVALAALAMTMRRLASEAAALQRSLRRVGATAIASDELTRVAEVVGDHAQSSRQAAQRVRGLRRNRPTAHR